MIRRVNYYITEVTSARPIPFTVITVTVAVEVVPHPDHDGYYVPSGTGFYAVNAELLTWKARSVTSSSHSNAHATTMASVRWKKLGRRGITRRLWLVDDRRVVDIYSRI